MDYKIEINMSKLIAHRGASLEALENTEKAFTIAGQSINVYGIETDV
jgi:glycerophosphoryl diester phosphodiesterase